MIKTIYQFFSIEKNKKLLFWGWWLILLIILILPNYSYYADSDEGVVLAGAWNLYNGQKIFADFFSFIPPGSYYFILAIWKIFAPSYLLTKLFSLLLIYLAAIGVYKIAEKLEKKYAWLAPAIFILASFNWQAINHNTYNIFFIIWGVYFFVKAFKNNEIINYAISGLFLGTATLFLQQKSLLVICLFAGWLAISAVISQTKKSWLIFFIWLLSTLSAISSLLLFAPAKTLYSDLFIFPLHNYPATNRMPFTLLAIITMLVIIIFFLLIKKQGTKKIFFLFLLQLTLLISTWPRPDWLHISIVLFPTLVLAPFIFQTKQKTLFDLSKISFLSISGVIFFTALASLVIFPPFHFFNKSELVKYINDNCQDSKYLYAGPFLPGLYPATKKTPATPFLILITGQQTEEQFALAASYLKNNRPECAVLSYDMVKKFKHNLDNPVDNYLFTNYQVVKTTNDYIILKIK